MIKEEICSLIDLSLGGDHPEELEEVLSLVETQYRAPYYRLLYYLAREVGPSLSVELGVHRAIGSACLKVGRPEGRVVGMDHLPHAQAYPICEKFGIDLREKSSCPPDGDMENIGILFLDTTVGMKPAEYSSYLPLMGSGGVILLDDLRSEEGINLGWLSVLPGFFECHELHEPVGFGGILL